MKDFPTYLVTIDDALAGMRAVSLVQYPAVERDFLLFDNDTKLTLQLASDEKRDIFGVGLLADTKIYRREGTYEYYITFTREVIEQLVERYSEQGLFNSVNLQHDKKAFVDSVILKECYIKDSARGITPKGFEDVPDGSLMLTYHVKDEALWNEIKTSGMFNGFSIEISCDLKPIEQNLSANKEQTIDEYVADLLS